MQKAEEFYKQLTDDNFEESIASAKVQQEYIKTSTARYHGYFVHTLYIPKMFTEEMAEFSRNQLTRCTRYLKRSYTNIRLTANIESYSVLKKSWKS